MDTGEGKFKMVEAKDDAELLEKMRETEALFPKHGGWFREGEEIEVRGSLFRVKRVNPTQIVLKLLKRSK